MSTTTAFRRPARTGRGLKSAIELLDVNAELRTATVRVDLSEVTEATAPVVAASRLAVNSLMGQVFAERLLGLDVSPARSYLDVAIPDRNPVVVYVSFATEPQRLLKAVRSNGDTRGRCFCAGRWSRRVCAGANGVDRPSAAVPGMARQLALTLH